MEIYLGEIYIFCLKLKRPKALDLEQSARVKIQEKKSKPHFLFIKDK